MVDIPFIKALKFSRVKVGYKYERTLYIFSRNFEYKARNRVRRLCLIHAIYIYQFYICHKVSCTRPANSARTEHHAMYLISPLVVYQQ